VGLEMPRTLNSRSALRSLARLAFEGWEPERSIMVSFATVTGIVGAITGPAGSVLGWISYRRSQRVKALDLRLELRKQVSDLRAVVEALPDLLNQSRASRTAVNAAMGVLKSGRK
jgi:hypothetical protein